MYPKEQCTCTYTVYMYVYVYTHIRYTLTILIIEGRTIQLVPVLLVGSKNVVQ